MATTRPTGVTLLGIAFILLGLLSLFWSLLVFGFGAATGVVGTLFGDGVLATVGGAQTIQGIIGIIAAVIDLVVAYGLLALKRWAWLLALIGVGVNVVSGVLGLFSGGFVAICCGVIGLVIPAGIVFYLLQPEVRQAFGR
ncbi:MAG: hypothetical protein KBG73_15495 [Candidatus Promineofilum sp.]|nr:hypothetical protein [Promineifilum sp.]